MKRARYIFVLMLLMAISSAASAQLHVGDLALTGSEALSIGYTDQYGDFTSAHGLGWGSQTTINGSYYDPKFLSFNVVPYFNQSRANSDSASVSNATGVSASTNLFSGSRIPTTFNYDYSNQSDSTYNLGEQSFTTHGSSSAFGVASSLNFEKLPPLLLMYQQGASSSELYGNSQEMLNNFHAFTANARYKLAGFQVAGGMQTHWGNSEIPNLFTGTTSEYDNSSKSYNVSATHNFWFHGGVGLGYDHESYSDTYTGGYNAGAIDLMTANVSMRPASNFQVNSNLSFNDNLAGVLQQSIVTANGATLIQSDGTRSNSLLITNTASYSGIRDIGLSGGYSYAQQTYAGVLYNSHSLDGEISYTRAQFFRGRFNATFGVTEDIREIQEHGYRFLTGWSRRFGAWGVVAGFNYHSNTRSLLLAYTTSGYSYSGSVNRKLGRFYWNASATAAKSKFDQIAQQANSSESFSTSLSTKHVSAGATYTNNTGNSFLTSTGLTNTDLPTEVLVAPVIFGGRSYSVNGSFSPFRSLQMAGSYVDARSSTLYQGLSSANTTTSSNVRLSYMFRKLWFTAGYGNFRQGFSASPVGPTSFSSFYFGLQRWFNFM